MKSQRKIRRKSEQSGIALLLAIFVLLLVCVVGIAMLGASGTETSLSGNYRSSTAVYYAALSGLEEGRSRLLPQNPNSLSPAFIPSFGSTLPLGHAIYITNPSPGPPADTVDPTALGNPDEFPDTEWATAFPLHNPPSSVQIVASVQSLSSMPGAQNALYKWVRINALTEQAIQIDVNNTGGAPNKTQIIYFDGTNLTRSFAKFQALGVTALAGLPDGSRKLLQYVVGPVNLGLKFNAAVTLASPGISPTLANYDPPAPGPPFTFYVNGTDNSGNSVIPGCLSQPSVPAFGVFSPSDITNVLAGTGTNSPNHYTGTAPSNNVDQIGSAAPINWQDPVQLSNLVQAIQNSADSVITGPAAESDMPAAMNSGNLMTVVVNGDLTLSGFTGYGILVVTGNFTYSGDSGWRGIVLVIGKGVVEETGSAGGGEFDGAVFVANTTGGVLGTTSWTVANPGGRGIYYSSCWISAAQKPVSYKVLSFREIPYP